VIVYWSPSDRARGLLRAPDVLLSCPWENMPEGCSEALSEKTPSEQEFCLWS
jgi:hypothetical protein